MPSPTYATTRDLVAFPVAVASFQTPDIHAFNEIGTLGGLRALLRDRLSAARNIVSTAEKTRTRTRISTHPNDTKTYCCRPECAHVRSA